MIKKNYSKMNRLLISCLLFLFTLFLSHIHIPLVSSIGLIPDYFLALFTTLIATRFINMNIYIYFLIGLIIDLLAGELIGQYGLVFIIIYTASFMMSWGPICWVLISEIFPNKIRSQAVAIAVAAQWAANFFISSTYPPMMEFSNGGTYLFYGAMSIISALFVWKYVPETKGKTLEEMEYIWKRS